jgi:prepilin-type N-terminal cleavage/methylation domain-containing protein
MSHRGFTLLETTIAVAVIGLVLGGATLFIFRNIGDTRETETLEKLIELKRALIGDPRIVTNESRTDFGYVGDTGSLPTSLEQLWVQGSQPTFTFTNTVKIGAGWQGPYLSVGPLEWLSAIPLDAWGMPIQYSTTTGTSAVTGQQYNARLTSYGPDGTSGGGDDLTVELYKPDLQSEVVGYVRDAGLNPLSGVTVTINYPVSGALTNQSVQTDAAGAYSFSNIPLGNRSIEVQPELVYVSGTAFTTPQNTGDNVEFVVQNFSSSDITFNSFKLEYSTTAFYEQLLIGNTSVFSSTSNRAASNELIQFPAQATTVLGSGSITGQTIPVRIQSAFTQVPDQNVGESAGKGGSIRLSMKNFKTVETGTGTSVNMTGVSIKATICSGAGCTTPSIAIFSPEKK